MEIRRAIAPVGDAQTARTLQFMQRETVRALYLPDVIQTATDIVRSVDGRDSHALVAAIDGWTRAHISYLDDPYLPDNGDFLRTPDYVLREIKFTGRARIDCDDAAMLTAALALSVGLVTRFRAVAFLTSDAPFQHVFTEILTQDGWIPLDITGSGATVPISRNMILEVV